MIGMLNAVEVGTLIEVLKDRLELVRNGLLEAEDYDDRASLKQTEEMLRRLINKLDRERLAVPQS